MKHLEYTKYSKKYSIIKYYNKIKWLGVKSQL